MTNEQFQQELYNRLSTVFTKALGQAMDARQIDRLNLEAKNLADLLTKQINSVAQERALEICKLLNNSIQEAFKLAYDDIAEIKAKLPE